MLYTVYSYRVLELNNILFHANAKQEYPVNPSVDSCARAENALTANSVCSSAFTSVISILSSGATGVTVGQLDGLFNILCEGSCGGLVSRYFTACNAKIVSICIHVAY